MIRVVTVSRMRSIDEAAIGGDEAKGYAYMLKAGAGLFEAARTFVPEADKGRIAVVCGRGNNGGDGYVGGRLLIDAGYRVTCFSLCKPEELSGGAKRAFDDYAAGKGTVITVRDTEGLSGLTEYGLIIDAMLGTGTRGNPRGIYAAAIHAINESGVPVLAADTPSGLDCDTGMPGSPCIKAVLTVAMGYPKIGQYFYPGREYIGKLRVHDLGYPERLLEGDDLFCPTGNDLRNLLPRRRPAGSKFDHGLALCICGSRGMSGSAVLVARAAQRSGCGMVHLAAPASVVPALSRRLIETVIHPLPETAAGTPSLAALDTVAAMAGTMQAVCLGPGISHEDETTSLVRAFAARCPVPLVLDADGLNAYKGRPGELGQRRGELLMTPHRGEWQRLFGALPEKPAAVADRVKETAVSLGATVLLKGNPTLVAEKNGRAYLLPFGSSALAKAGSGDVLSGVIVSLLAQGALPAHAALLGAFIHGNAGKRAGVKFSDYSVIASDVIREIPKVIKQVLGK